MTNDFKKTTLDYITGNLEIEDSKSISFRDESQFQNNLLTILTEMNITPRGTLKYLSSNTTSNYILYGNYNDGNDVRSFIVVFNQNGGIERIFLTFDSGTFLNEIEYLEYDENGNIYGIDYVDFKPRIILLNNVALKIASGYSCKLRASYYIPEPYSYQFTTPFVNANEGTSPIKKVNGEAIYYIVGTNSTTGYSQDNKIAILEFVNIVGAPNEWNLYTGETIGNVLYTTDFIIENDDDENVIDIYCQINSLKNDFVHYYFDGETITSVATYTIGHVVNDIRIKSSNEVYFCGKKTENDITTYITYQLVGGSYFNIFQYKPNDYDLGINYLTLKNNILFETIYGKPQTSDPYIECLVWNENKLISNTTNLTYTFNLPCIIQNTYALYKFIIQDTNNVYQPSIVIYDSSYSGKSYINYNALVSLHGELYNNGNIIFARNLYNKSSLNNTTTSVLEVPFNYINDITIDIQNLLSATQLPLVSNQEVLMKNIYENLFINFINTINVIDEDTSTNYPQYATRINNSLNTGTQQDYEGDTIQKVHINTDNQVIQKIYWKHIDDTHLETSFTIYIDSTPNTIEFMNMDETYTFFTKDISNLEIGKYYTITQKIRME